MVGKKDMRVCNECAFRGSEVRFFGVEFASEGFISGDAGEVIDLF